MDKQAKINKIGMQMSMALESTALAIKRKAFQPKKTKATYEQVKKFLEENTSLYSINYISLADDWYNLISYKDWETAIENDIVNLTPYKKQETDCENFAYMFASKMGYEYGINSCGVVHGKVNIGHFWNCIITDDWRLYYYDVKKEKNGNLGVALYEKGRPIIIGGWTYTPDSYRMY